MRLLRLLLLLLGHLIEVLKEISFGGLRLTSCASPMASKRVCPWNVGVYFT